MTDLCNNELSGQIPESLASLKSLQIVHLKQNLFNGSLPSSFGNLPLLSWFDVSSNQLIGTIPETFGSSTTLKDFRVGGNMIYDPIPRALCSNIVINGGMTKTHGCAGVICPLGTYSAPGHATQEGCKTCPDGETTLYLGSQACSRFTEKDILTMLYAVMGHSSSSGMQKSHWLDQDDDDDVCSWRGIKCDPSNKTVETISFPLYGIA